MKEFWSWIEIITIIGFFIFATVMLSMNQYLEDRVYFCKQTPTLPMCQPPKEITP